MKLTFCGKIKEGEDSEFLIGDDIVAEVLENYDFNNKKIHLRYSISNSIIDENNIVEDILKKLYGGIEVEHGCIPFSEWTGFVAWDDTLVVGGHDLIKELLCHEGKYCYLEFYS